jgi:RHS repeat-associated protein
MRRPNSFLMRHLSALLALSVLTFGLPTAAVAATATAPPVDPPPTQQEPVLPYTEVRTNPAPPPGPPAEPPRAGVNWPRAASADVTPVAAAKSAARYVRAGDTPVLVAASATGKTAPPLRVEVADQRDTVRARISGVLFSVRANGPAAPVSVAVDYSSFANAVGGNFGNRLRLTALPACARTTPDVPACQAGRPLKSVNDGVHQQVAADLAATDFGQDGTAVLAATAAPAGPNGDFAASSLAPSGTWAMSGASGSFTWSYPIPVPPPAAASPVVPDVSLDYDSGSVDGRMATTNDQPSWVGQGWDYSPGYVERTYRSCAEDTALPEENQTGDMCWAGEIVTVHVDGSSTSLVRDDDTGTWHPGNDNGEKVERLTGAGNGAHDGEYWRITRADGVRYYFGLDTLPGGSSANQTDSVLTTRVYGPHSGDPCYDTGGFAKSGCAQAWRWNLDYVEDPSGNAAAYYYQAETNYYGANRKTDPVAYQRGGYLTRVEYGLRNVSDSVFGSPAPRRVVFDVAERCTPVAGFTCAPGDFTEANADRWPDTPQDQNCAATGTCDNHSPTFWSRKRLTEIRTEYRSGNSYVPVDTFALGQSFPTTGDPSLRLDSIVRTGHLADGTTATLPAVSFSSENRPNRVVGYNSQPPMLHHRLTRVDTETGQTITVHYGGDDGQEGRSKPLCTTTTVPAKPELDDAECYPVTWTPDFAKDPILDYFHKYVVTEVDVADRSATSPTRMTTYSYVGNPAWHFDDNEVVKPKNRTYGQFRGYGTVNTRTGNPNAASNGTADKWTLSTAVYFRGMNGDRLPNGARRSATVTNSLGETAPDDNRLADTPIETRAFDADGGTQVSTELTTLAVVATNGSRARAGLDDLTADVTRTSRTRSVTNIAAGGTLVATIDSAYDSLGRLTRQSETGTNLAPKCTTTSYGGNAASGIHDRPAEVIVSAQACPAPGTDQSPIVARTRTFYDGSDTLGVVGDAGLATSRLRAVDTSHWARTSSTYDDYGRESSTTEFTSTADTTGRTSRKVYHQSANGVLTGVDTVNALGQTATSVLDPGRGVAVHNTDIAGLVTDAEYDPLGRVVKVWNPGYVRGTDQPTIQHSYLVSQTAPLAVTTKTLVDTGTGAGYRTSVALYDSNGELRQTQTDAVGGGRAVSDVFLDSHGWKVRNNNRWYTTGAPGPTLITTADSGIDSRTVTTFDGMGRPVVATDYRGTTATWSTRTTYGGDRMTVTPPAGGVLATTVNDARGQTIELAQWTTPPTITGNVVSGGVAQRTGYAYDALGRQVSMTTAVGTSQATTWTTTYDVGGRTVAKSDPDSGQQASTFDDVDEQLTAKDADQHVTGYVYDKLGRKVEEHDGSTTGPLLASWTFDTLQPGKLTSSTRSSPTGTVKIAASGYTAVGDQTGTRTEVTEPGFLASYTTGYTWTGTHLMRTQTLPSSEVTAGVGVPAETITFAYDASGAPKSSTGINAYVSNTSFSPYGEANQFTLGVNTLTSWLTYTRDAQTRRVTGVNLSGQTAPPQLENVAYTYDPAGNVTRSVDTQGAPGAPVQTQCYTYDKLRQLTQAWSSTDSCATNPTTLGNNSKVGGPQKFWTTWTIDAAGSRTKQVQNAVPGSTTPTTTTTYTMATAGHPHALSSTTTTPGATTSYGYDANGNMTSRNLPTGPQTITYDQQQRVRTITAGSKTVEYANDADGNQVLRRSDGVTTLYLPDQEISRVTATGAVTVTKYYKHGDATVAMRVNKNNPTYLMSDLHGSNQVAVNPATWAVSRRYLDPYGNPLGTATGSWPDPHGFLDKPKDPTTGLSDLGARKYDPTTGRFLTSDPIVDPANPQALNGYSYAANNPIFSSDATGLIPLDDGGAPIPPEHNPTPTKKKTKKQGPTPSKDYTRRHDRAVDAAVGVIRRQVKAAGGDPDDVVSETRIPFASKNFTGNDGSADITYDDGEVIWVWEVKTLAQAGKATAEARWYAANLEEAHPKRRAEVGWSIGGPHPVIPTFDLITGTGPGAIVYYDPRRVKPTRHPVPVKEPKVAPIHLPLPIVVPQPEPQPSPEAPDTGGHGDGWKWWVGGGLVGAGVAGCLLTACVATVVGGIALGGGVVAAN